MSRFVCAALLLPVVVASLEAQDSDWTVSRTPDSRFENLEGYPFEANYIEINGLRMHYVDEGFAQEGTMLLLHGEPTWSYLYREMIPVFVDAGYRVVAPDMIGFGKSDKVVERDWYTLDRHLGMLQELVRRLDLQDVTVVVQDWGGPNGLVTATEMPQRFERLIILNTWLHHEGYEYTQALRRWRVRSQEIDFTKTTVTPENPEGYRAPFHTEEATAGAYRWPWMLPFAQPREGGAERQEGAFRALGGWDKPAHVIFGAEDRIFTPEWGREFANHIPGATFDTVPGAGHFVQETGAPLAELILEKIRAE
ncbi:MAG: alpha/beta fold hydrolase [Longimicrobiales bacterium]